MRYFPPERAAIRIDAAALIRNFRLLQKKAGNARLFAVVKANAYGHGLEGVTGILAGAGCTAFAVATLEEACTVRLHAPGAAILILGYTPPEKARLLSELSLTQTVFSARYAKALDAAASAAGRVVTVHYKIDGGMTRLGLPIDGARAVRDITEACPMLLPTGIFTHFPTPENREATTETLTRFRALCAELTACGLRLPRHAAASAALLAREDAALDAVRPGLALFGISPVPCDLPLTPVLTLTAPIVQIHEVPRGTPVGYGGAFITERRSKIGTLPLGYGDGFSRALAGFPLTLLHKKKQYHIPVAGRICMDQTMVDLTGTPAKEGDTVSVFGDVAVAARAADTIPYEILTALGARLLRSTVFEEEKRISPQTG